MIFVPWWKPPTTRKPNSIKITITEQLNNQLFYIDAMESKIENYTSMTIIKKLEYIEMKKRLKQV